MTRNLPLFIAFRLLFNSRFYYPIFAVIQLDYGLTLTQFAILNAVWSISIVLLEVPSGALADRFGRKRIVVAASILMVLEMGVLAFVPLGSNSIVFWAWVLNRILSGAAEAAASGADEALAYDSIPKESREQVWLRLLTRLMRLSSIALVVATLIGAAVYDPNLVNRVLAWIGSSLQVDKETILRFPIYLTLGNAIIAVFVTLMLKEPPLESECGGESSLWSGVFATGSWILRRPIVCSIILAALVHDSILRLFTVTASEYYRLIGIPVLWFGVIGAAFSTIGIFTPKLAEWLVIHASMRTNYRIVSLLTLLGLVGVSFAIPYWGVVMVVFFSLGFTFLNYFSSHYLNAQVDSRRRATVLSFRGLALNLGFGAMSLLYGSILRLLREEKFSGALTESSNRVYRESLYWLPGIFLVAFTLWWAHDRWRLTPDLQNGISSSDSSP